MAPQSAMELNETGPNSRESASSRSFAVFEDQRLWENPICTELYAGPRRTAVTISSSLEMWISRSMISLSDATSA